MGLSCPNDLQLYVLDGVSAKTDGDITDVVGVSLLEEAIPVAARWQGQGHVAEHGVVVEHVAEDDATPEVYPADRTALAANHDRLPCLLVKPVLRSRFGQRHKLVSQLILQRQELGDPLTLLLLAAMVEVEVEILVYGEESAGEGEGGDGVLAVAVADDGDLGVVEAHGARRGRDEVEQRRVGRAVDEVIPCPAGEGGEGIEGDDEEEEVGVGGDDLGRGAEEVEARAVDAEVGEERRACGAEGDLDGEACAGCGLGGGGVGEVADVAPYVDENPVRRRGGAVGIGKWRGNQRRRHDQGGGDWIANLGLREEEHTLSLFIISFFFS